MGNSPTPPGLLERILLEVDRRIASFARSGFLRNAKITQGGLTIAGGFLRLLFGDVTLFYIGPYGPSLPDGTAQQGWVIRRADGTKALDMLDADVSDGQVNQAVNWWDRAGNIVLADDTNGGQGLARPYVPLVFYPARNGDWTSTTSSTFDVLHRARAPKQQPRLTVKAWAFPSTAGTAGELRVMVNGTQLGDTIAFVNDGFIHEYTFGPLPVAGAHMSAMTVEIQARRTAGAGVIQVAPAQGQGEQS